MKLSHTAATPDAISLKGVMPEGSSFPYDFGFVPSTLGEDGDPLDVLVLMDAPASVGCVLSVRLIGVIEAKQREEDGEWVGPAPRSGDPCSRALGREAPE